MIHRLVTTERFGSDRRGRRSAHAGARVLPKTNRMVPVEGQRPNSYQPWPPAKVLAQTNPERQRRGSLCPRPKETWNLPHPASRGCINTVTMSLVGMARCAVTVAERSVRRRNESSESPGFGQRAERLNKRARFANSIALPDAALGGADGAARHPYLSWQGQCLDAPRIRSPKTSLLRASACVTLLSCRLWLPLIFGLMNVAWRGLTTRIPKSLRLHWT